MSASIEALGPGDEVILRALAVEDADFDLEIERRFAKTGPTLLPHG